MARPRSNSQTKALSKAPALRLIASVLDMLSPEANRLVRQRDYLDGRRKDTADGIADHSRRREIDAAAYDTEMNEILKRHGVIEKIADGLFSRENVVHNYRDAINLQSNN